MSDFVELVKKMFIRCVFLFYTSSISCCFVACLLCFLTLFGYILFVVPCLDKRGRIGEDEDDGRYQKRVLVEILQTVNRMDEDVKRVNENVKRVNDVVTNMATINDSTGTPSHQGTEALQGCPLKLNLPESDSKKVFEEPLDTKTEGETLTVIFSKLRSLLPDGLSLGDSQSCKWLPQTLDGANLKNDLKPDGFVVFSRQVHYLSSCFLGLERLNIVSKIQSDF